MFFFYSVALNQLFKQPLILFVINFQYYFLLIIQMYGIEHGTFL